MLCLGTRNDRKADTMAYLYGYVIMRTDQSGGFVAQSGTLSTYTDFYHFAVTNEITKKGSRYDL